ncbi:hypothetical protein JCM10450v2_006179 [Rhodotorula kratochvilovae]
MSTPPHPLARLRPFPPAFPSLACHSADLVQTDVPYTCREPRAHFLSPASISTTPPPVIARSPFIPNALVEHLMRNKRDSAITTKYLPGTAITNGEAALHSFVTALVPTTMCGDYAWQGGHSVIELGTTPDARHRLGRRVILSTALHQDFEDGQVAELFYAVEREVLEGRDISAYGPFRVPSVEEKDNNAARASYDLRLKRHAVHHLVRSRVLPALGDLPYPPWSVAQATTLLKRHFATSPSEPTSTTVQSRFLLLASGTVLSLEFLYVSYVASLSNELSKLEALCPAAQGGYAYTFSPPSIFARRLPPEFSTLLVLLALHELVLASSPAPAPALPAMRLFALGAHTPALAALLPLARSALPSHIALLTREQLFPPPGGTLVLPPSAERAALVLHNNSDAFGQNVQSEQAGGSLDGVLGAWGDASRGLRRERADLCHWVG